jgi:thiosulfate/3-mercaptopyruvate sulfurtransferase
MFSTIITTHELVKHLGDPNWIIVDCRFDLMDSNWGYLDYLRSHIPGAVYASLKDDLSGLVTPTSGRHPLPDPQVFAHTLSRLGVENMKQVIVYDTINGAFASRLWWMLRFYGHFEVAVLEGGLTKWLHETRPIRSGEEQNKPGAFHFLVSSHQSALLETHDIEEAKIPGDLLLIDARSPERYRGEKEPIDPVAGHIPGAVNRFHGENLNPDGTFKPPELLFQEFEQLVGKIDPQNVGVYCGSGVTSCFNILAMENAGLHGAKLYAGSWSQWIRDPSRPIAKTSSH